MTKFESVLAQAMELDGDERLLLALRLDASVDSPVEHERAWAEELKRRLGEIEQGHADLMDWEEFRKELVTGDR